MLEYILKRTAGGVGIVVLVMGGTAAMYAYSYLVWRNAKRRSM